MFPNKYDRQSLLQLIHQKRSYRQQNVLSIEKMVKENRLKVKSEITELDFDILRTKLHKELLTPSEVLLAFQQKAVLAHKATNCVVEFLIEATKWAEEVEQKFSGKEKPYLYGMPISLKENFKVKGHDSTIGLAQLIGKPYDEDCLLVKRLKELGAVPFVLTNVPQTMCSIGSRNPIFSATLNPFDHTRTAGGSSSGEGALLALGGSPVGFGTDVGGSVRVPAHYCGVYSLKPSVDRMTQQGIQCCNVSAGALRATAGFMGPSVESIVHMCRALWSDTSFDPMIAPLSFNENLFNSTKVLKIGFFDSAKGHIEPVPACKRAVKSACDLLKRRGHNVVPFDVPVMPDFCQVYWSMLFSDNGQLVNETLENDIVTDNESVSLRQDCDGKTICQKWVRSLDHLRDMCGEIHTYKQQFIQAVQKQGIECLICPVAPNPALPLDIPVKLGCAGWSYCSLFNILDMPAGVAPLIEVTKDDIVALKNGYNVTGDVNKAIIRDSSLDAQGLPIAVQVVAMPFKDETCLRVMKELTEYN